jgi:hypothetical protein
VRDLLHPDLKEILTQLDRTIRDDVRVQTGSVAALTQRLHTIKPKVNCFLDVAVKTYHAVNEEMERKDLIIAYFPLFTFITLYYLYIN